MANQKRKKRRRQNKQARRQQVALAGEATQTAPSEAVEIRLVQAVATGGEKISVQDTGGDMGGGLISDVAIMTVGTAYPLGHEPFEVDEATLQQLAEAINESPDGVSCRFTHPELQESAFGGYVDSIGFLLGRVKNVRIVGSGGQQQVRGDVHIGTYADEGPNGKIGTRVKRLAKESPTDCGMSCVAGFIKAERMDNIPLGRVAWCSAVDFVGNPGGNPNGLLAGEKNQPGRGDGSPGETRDGERTMKYNAEQLAYLASCGLGKGATPEQITALAAGLKPAQKTYLESLAGEKSAEKPPAETTSRAGEKPVETTPAETTSLAGSQTVSDADRQRISAEAVVADKTRRDGIVALAKDKKLPEKWARDLGDRGISLAHATELAELAGTMQLVAQPGGPRVSVGDDLNAATLSPALSDCMCLSAGVPLLDYQHGQPVREGDGSLHFRQPHERAATIDTRSPVMLAKRYLREIAAPGIEDMSEGQILQLALNRKRLADHMGDPRYLAMGTGDFVHALDTSIQNSVRAKYWQQTDDATWMRWCHRTTNPDYRATGYVVMSEIPDLLVQAEGENIRSAVIKDSKQTIIVYRFGRSYRFTQQSLKNGLSGLLTDFPAGLVNAARRKESMLPIATLIANPMMADGTVLFHADHGNYVANDAGAAPSVTTLNAMYVAMKGQTGILDAKDGDGSPMPLEISPHGLLVPTQLDWATEQMIKSPVDPTKQNATPNILAGKLPGGVTGLAQLSQASTTRWYGFAKPGSIGGGMVLAFLDGEEAPVVETDSDFDSDDYKVKITHNLGSGASDHRGIYCNEGVIV